MEHTIRMRVRHDTPWREIRNAMLRKYRERSALGFALIVAQAFFYNARCCSRMSSAAYTGWRRRRWDIICCRWSWEIFWGRC